MTQQPLLRSVVSVVSVVKYLSLSLGFTITVQTIYFILDTGIYVDDDFLAFEFLPPGARWCNVNRRIEVKQELVESDLDVEEDLRTMREISRMADSICLVLQTTYDCPSLQQSGRMPILNLQVWVERVEKEGGGGGEWEIMWEYY